MDTFIVIAIFVFAAAFLTLSVLSFLEKGPLLNNAWIWANEEERKKPDKRPHYRQSAIAFLLLAGVFAALGIDCLTDHDFWRNVSFVLSIASVIYAVLSSARINRSGKP